jgi:penicillin-binding protein 1A
MAGIVVAGVVVLWIATPSGQDVQARNNAVVRQRGTAALAPGAVPPPLAHAIVATEDERFYQNHGVDALGLARSALADIQQRCLCQGGSTITEQLVKDLYLNGADRGPAKLVDMVLALKVDRILTKQQILADYLNEVPTGLGLYGVDAAARAYYGCPVTRLDLAQYALIAGMPRGPALYDPRLHPQAARERRSQVLGLMLSEHDITPAQAAAANREPVLPTPGAGRPSCTTPPPTG